MSGKQFQENLANRYNILERVNKGAAGTIYKAYDPEKESLVAIKRLHACHPKDGLLLKREFRYLSNTSHDNLVEFHDLIIQEKICFCTMEWIFGSEIFKKVWGEPDPYTSAINYDLLRKIIIQLTAGIQYLHNLGMMHRDIKPDNILIDTFDKAVLLDFGLARRYCGYLPEWENLQAIDGTLAYMAPEVLHGLFCTPASDWYSLGVVLYECLTGKLPNVILGVDPTPPASLFSETPADLNSIALALLNRDALLRPSGHEILQALSDNGLLPSAVRCSRNTQKREYVGRGKELFF